MPIKIPRLPDRALKLQLCAMETAASTTAALQPAPRLGAGRHGLGHQQSPPIAGLAPKCKPSMSIPCPAQPLPLAAWLGIKEQGKHEATTAVARAGSGPGARADRGGQASTARETVWHPHCPTLWLPQSHTGDSCIQGSFSDKHVLQVTDSDKTPTKNLQSVC